MSLLRRGATPAESAAPPLPDGVVDCQLHLPALYEFLTMSRWDEKTPRRLGTISVFWEDGSFKVWVNDKDGQRCSCVSSFALRDCLLKVEAKLTDDSLEWRKARPEQGRAGKK